MPASERGDRFSGYLQLGVVVLVVAAGIYFGRAPDRVAIDPGISLGTTSAPPNVTVVQPASGSHSAVVSLTGTVGPHGLLTMMVSAPLGGRIEWISPALRLGGTFEADEVLLKLESRDYELAVAGAEADVRQAEAKLEQARLEGEAGSAEYRRSNPGADIPALIARKPQIAKAQAKLDEMLVRLEAARIALERTQFSLPFDGRVARAQLSIGQLVVAGTPFATAYATDSMEVAAKIAPGDLAYLQPALGRRATILAEDKALSGEVVRVSAQVDIQSRMPRLFLKFDDDIPLDALPLPGAFTTVTIEGPAFDDVFLLPTATEQPGGKVWIVDDGALRPVTPATLRQAVSGWLDSPGWLVRAFDAGDGVVVGSVFGAHHGMRVTVAAD